MPKERQELDAGIGPSRTPPSAKELPFFAGSWHALARRCARRGSHEPRARAARKPPCWEDAKGKVERTGFAPCVRDPVSSASERPVRPFVGRRERRPLAWMCAPECSLSLSTPWLSPWASVSTGSSTARLPGGSSARTYVGRLRSPLLARDTRRYDHTFAFERTFFLLLLFTRWVPPASRECHYMG